MESRGRTLPGTLERLTPGVLALGLFDSDPELTFGCSQIDSCRPVTPFPFSTLDSVLFWTGAGNRSAENRPYQVHGTISNLNLDLAQDTGQVFAVWMPVPDPSTPLLLTTGQPSPPTGGACTREARGGSCAVRFSMSASRRGGRFSPLPLPGLL